MEPLLQVIYASTATGTWTPSDLLTLLQVSRVNNTDVGVTGFLGHNQGTFLQLLEGPEQAVRQTIDRIRADVRHREVTMLAERVVATRFFPDWSMGFQELDEVVPGPGLSSLLPQARSVASWAADPELAIAFFEVCRPRTAAAEAPGTIDIAP